MCGSGISQIFEQTFRHRIWGFLLSKIPTLFLAAVVAVYSALCSSGQKDWIFYWNFICSPPPQYSASFGLSKGQKSLNKVAIPLCPKVLFRILTTFFSLSSAFRVFCLFFWLVIIVIYSASGPITSWERDGETVETMSDFILGGCKITADRDCSHEIKRHSLEGKL